MKKVIIAAGLILVFALLGYFVWQNSNEQNGTSEKQEIPGFEKPEEKPDISGIVKTIIGNEVTILKIERQTPGENDIENEDKETEKDGEKTGSGGGMGMGGGMGSRVDTDEDSEARIEMLKSMNTGEEKVTIPVGIKMIKNTDGEATIVTLNDIKKDQLLMIWTDKAITDKNIATFVMIK